MDETRRGWITIMAFLAFVGLPGCTDGDAPSRSGGADSPGALELVADLSEPVERGWGEIQERDTLVALVTSNSTSYFVYRGLPMGFEYDLLKAFADERDLALRTRVVRDRRQLFRRLNDGEGDVVAARLIPVAPYRKHVRFTRPLYETSGALVQRAAPPGEAMETLPDIADTLVEGEGSPGSVEVPGRLVRRPGQLAGQSVALPYGSEYYLGLLELSDSIGRVVDIVEVDSAYSVESLVRQVAEGGIQMTVAPENVADLRSDYFTNLVVRPTVVPSHDVAWATRINAPSLQARLDEWLVDNAEQVAAAYQVYFVDRKGYRERLDSEYLTSETGSLSPYDTILAEAALQIGWDWRLLASQAYQESRFDPSARSWAGARGLLQLMPATAREFGVTDLNDPTANVQGAVDYLDWLDEQWSEEIADRAERIRFVLASYNTGRGHVLDARRLAEKHGDDPDDWETVAYWLMQKSKRDYYTDPVVRYGYCRGLEPVTYVALILDRYDHYRQFVEGQPLDGEATTRGNLVAARD